MSAPYTDASLPVERRVDDLLDRMTLEEKAAQLTAVRADELLDDGDLDRERTTDLLGDGVGHLTRLGGEGDLDPRDAAETYNEIQDVLAGTRLGIPAIAHEECLSGYMGPKGRTFPQAIGLASTWSPDLVEAVTEHVRGQLLAIGCRHALSPVLDLGVDPRWGRTEETFGEDPYLVAAMACAYVRGLQGEGGGVTATLKHFAGHGASEGGKNRSSVDVGERVFRETHLLPFEAAVRTADAGSVMNAYHDVDGIPCARSRELLTDVLRGEWGFDGTVVSDYYSVRYLRTEHGVAATDRDAAVMALEAGLDVELPQREGYGAPLVAAVRDGDLAEETLDRSVRRVLRAKVEAGLLDDPTVDPAGVEAAFDTEDGAALSRRAARESVVLLKNDGVLPLENPVSVAVVGPMADDAQELLGDYAYAAHYPETETEFEATTPREAIEERVESVSHVEGCTVTGPSTAGFEDAVAAAEDAEVVLAFVGARSAVEFGQPEADVAERPAVPTSGEGRDVTDLGLPGVQGDLIHELLGTGTPVVVVLVSGKPHAIEAIDERAPAVCHAWLPGGEGGPAIADVLLGDHAPGGRLPVSVPRGVGQLPVYYYRRPNSRTEPHVYADGDPLYPFGHGLSYTEFAYDDLTVTPGEVGAAGTVTASVTVENVGEVPAHEVVQLYVHDVVASQARPVQELQGFERVHLDPGEAVRVRFELGTAQLAFHDESMELAVEPGAFEVRIGRSADDIRERARFVVEDGKTVPGERRFFADTDVEAR